MNKSATLTLRRWGNSLAVRIPAAIARSAQFVVGQPVTISAEESGIVVKSIGTPKPTLAQKLAAFDPKKHSGETMASRRVGKEVF